MTRLFAGCGAAALTAAASGGVSFTFDDPGSGAEFIHMGPTVGDPFGTISFRSDLPVDLVVTDDAALPGDAPLATFSSFFEVDWVVDAIFTAAGDPVQAAEISGTFVWRDAGTDEVILSGEFVDSAIVAFGSAGSVVTSSAPSGGALEYTAGQPLIDAGVSSLLDPQDAAWTLTDLAFAGASVVEVDGERFFNTFTSNAAFTGTSEIPAPGALVLAGLAGLATLRRRG